MNSKIGYLSKIQESNFRLENSSLNVFNNEFLTNPDKKVLIIETKQTFFSAISIYQVSMKHCQSENLNFIFSDWTLFRKYKKEINEKIESADTKSVLII